MKNCPSFKQKPEKQLGPAVQEQLPVEENAWPRAESCDPVVKVSSRSSMRPLLLWAAGKAAAWEGNTDMKRKVETRCAERNLSLREWEVSFCKSLVYRFPAGLRSPLSAAATSNLSLCSKSFLPKGKRDTQQKGRSSLPQQGPLQAWPILAVKGFSSCPVSAESSNPTLVPCHMLQGRSCQSLSAYVSALQTSCKENVSW